MTDKPVLTVERPRSLAERMFPDLAAAFHVALRHWGSFASCGVAACADHHKAIAQLANLDRTQEKEL